MFVETDPKLVPIKAITSASIRVFTCRFQSLITMGDEQVTKADFQGFTEAITTTLTALSDQITTLTNLLNNNHNQHRKRRRESNWVSRAGKKRTNNFEISNSDEIGQRNRHDRDHRDVKVKEEASKNSAPSTKSASSLKSVAGVPAGASGSGPVSEDEIREVLLHKAPVTTQDLVAKFKSRLRSKEDKDAFAVTLRRIAKIQKTNGPSYVVLRDK